MPPELTDRAAPSAQIEAIRGLAQSVGGVLEVHQIRTRFLGAALAVDLHVLVDGSLSVYDGYAIAARVKRKLLDEGPDIVDVVVHIEPFGLPETGAAWAMPSESKSADISSLR